jgi:hypothetical protein
MIYSPAGLVNLIPLPLPTGRQALPPQAKSMNLRSTSAPATKESVTEKYIALKISPDPSFPKRGNSFLS